MPDIYIRSAKESDIESLLNLLPQITRNPEKASAIMPDLQTASQRFKQMQQTGQTVLVAETRDNLEIVGTCTLLILPALVYGGRSFAQIEHMVVAQTHRGQGIGTALMKYAVEQAQKSDCYKIQLLTGRLDEQVGFYNKQGFDESKTTGFKIYL